VGITLLRTFRLEEKGWLENCYAPLNKVIEKFMKEKGDIPECAGILDLLEQEMRMYQKFKNCTGTPSLLCRNRRIP
jgi:hypothetical protein